METTYDSTFLNSLFTSDDFEFIKYLDSDNELFDEMLNKQQSYRNLIVRLINILNNDSFREDSKDLLIESQHIFEIINNNISSLQQNREISKSTSKKIMDLLIKIETDGNNINQEKYVDEINTLKNSVSNYMAKSDEIKKAIVSNDSEIHSFFQKGNVQRYLEDSSSYSFDNKDKSIKKEQLPKEWDKENVIINDVEENSNVLIVSETTKKVYLPYSKKEVLEYLEKYPNQYSSFKDVVEQEFIYPLDFYLKHTVISRFRETYALIRDREAKSAIEAFKMSMDMMFHYDLNPAVIAACKSQEQLENYLDCLKTKNLNNFKDFEIKFEIAPLSVKN